MAQWRKTRRNCGVYRRTNNLSQQLQRADVVTGAIENMSFETKSILVVDDSPLVSSFVGQLLVRVGFITVLARNGRGALDRLAGEPFTAVVSDVEMPVMDGFELARNVHLRYPEVPVVLMSFLFDEQRRETALASGAADLLQKPVTKAKLLAALRRNSLLDSWHCANHRNLVLTS
jgi:CheY-like chemotaxis protein